MILANHPTTKLDRDNLRLAYIEGRNHAIELMLNGGDFAVVTAEHEWYNESQDCYQAYMKGYYDALGMRL